MANSGLKSRLRKKRVLLIYTLYWFLLSYVIAALIFWFISLNQQNDEIISFKKAQLNSSSPAYVEQLKGIENEDKRKKIQYIGEGFTFLFLILAGAGVVFRLLRAQFRLANQQKEFMVAITHELKTPIAVTKLNLETLQKRELNAGMRQKILTVTLAETDRLNALCNNMLLLNELDTTHGRVMIAEKFPLKELLDECINENRMHYTHRNFLSDLDETLELKADRMLSKLAVNNLIDNAVKYSPKDTAVRIRAFRSEDAILLQVIDEGEGVHPDEMNKIFEKYYRGTGERAKGTGLGLYVTRLIIKQSGGSLSVQPNHPKGSIFTISFAGQ